MAKRRMALADAGTSGSSSSSDDAFAAGSRSRRKTPSPACNNIMIPTGRSSSAPGTATATSTSSTRTASLRRRPRKSRRVLPMVTAAGYCSIMAPSSSEEEDDEEDFAENIRTIMDANTTNVYDGEAENGDGGRGSANGKASSWAKIGKAKIGKEGSGSGKVGGKISKIRNVGSSTGTGMDQKTKATTRAAGGRTRGEEREQRRVTISGDGPSVAIIPRGGGGGGGNTSTSGNQGGDGSSTTAGGITATTTGGNRHRPVVPPLPPPSILRNSRGAPFGVMTAQVNNAPEEDPPSAKTNSGGGAAGATCTVRPGGTASILARLAASKRPASVGGARIGTRTSSTGGADAILPSPSKFTAAGAGLLGHHRKEVEGDDDGEMTVGAESVDVDEETLRSTKKRLSFKVPLRLAVSDMEEDDAAAFADDESDASSTLQIHRRPVATSDGRHHDRSRQPRQTQQSSSSSAASSARPRSKRPTPMDLAWRQVALDEKEGRLPDYVAETEAEKRMERLSEKARREGEELRRIRQLNRDGDDDAYLEALGEYLSSHRKERRKQKKKTKEKKGADTLAKSQKRRKVDRSRFSASQRSRLDDERSNDFTTGSESSTPSERENNTNSLLREEEKNVAATKKMVRVGSDQTNKDEMPMDLLLTLATDEEEGDGSTVHLGSTLAAKWRGTAELESLAKEHRRFVIQYKATYHKSNKSIRDAAAPSSSSDRKSAKIRPKDLIIKVRLAHPLNGSNESICSFANWALPGATDSSERKGSGDMATSSLKPVISESVRRGSSIGLGGGQKQGGSYNPPLFLDRDLSFEDKAKVRSFLTDASPGFTPLQFFSKLLGSYKKTPKGPGGVPLSSTAKYHQTRDSKMEGIESESSDSGGSAMAMIGGLDEDTVDRRNTTGGANPTRQAVERDNTGIAVSKQDQVDELEYASTVDATANDRVGISVLHRRSENKESSSRKPSSSSSSASRRRPLIGRDSSDSKVSAIVPTDTAAAKETDRPIPDGVGNAFGPTSSSDLLPRTRTARASAKKRKHNQVDSGGIDDPPKVPSKRTYESRARKRVRHRPVTFSCNELPGSDAGTASCFGLIEGIGGGTSERDNADNHPLDTYLPFRGKVTELGGGVKVGDWSGTIVEDENSSSLAVLRDSVADLRGIRIELRHQDAKDYGPLKDRFASDSSLTFSVSNPRLARTQCFRNQRGVLDADEIAKIVGAEEGRRLSGPDGVPFVGSISLALLSGGFQSISHENDEGAKTAENMLDGCRLLADKNRFRGSRSDLLPICDIEDKEEKITGVSFPCRIECVDSYWVIIAQNDESQTIVAADIVFEDPDTIPDVHSSDLASGNSMSSISESTRTVRHVVLPLTADNLHRYEHEKQATEAHERTYADEERGSSSEEASRTSFADLGAQPNHQEQQYITSSRRSSAVNEETQADDEDDYRQRSTDLATPKARDVIKTASAGRTGTTMPLSSADMCSAFTQGDDRNPTQHNIGHALSSDDEEKRASQNTKDFLGNDEDFGKVALEGCLKTGPDHIVAAAEDKAVAGSAVLEVERAEDVHNSSLPFRFSMLSRDSHPLRNRCKLTEREGQVESESFPEKLKGPGSKVLEIYDIREVGGTPAKTGALACEEEDAESQQRQLHQTQVQDKLVETDDGTHHTPDDVQLNPGGSVYSRTPESIETVGYSIPTDSPIREAMEPRPPNRIIHSPGSEFSIGSCDWETSPKESASPTLQSFALMATPNASEEAETAEEEVFSTPEQMLGCDTAEAQTNPSSPPTSFLTPEVHSISTGADARYQSSDFSPQRSNLADTLGTESEIPRPWVVHSAIFGAQDVDVTLSSPSLPVPGDALMQQSEVLAMTPFFFESPGSMRSQSEGCLGHDARIIMYGAQDEDAEEIEKDNSCVKETSLESPAITDPRPPSPYSIFFGQESGGEELEVLQNTRSRLPEMLVGGSCLPTHAIVYGGQDINPNEELLSPQNSALCMEPPLLAMAPFFLESPGSTRRKSSSGEGDANSIGSSLDSTHPPLPFHALLYGQGGSPPQHLSGCEPIFTKQPGNTLGRPIFLSSASYEEDEEYSFRPTSLFRDAVFGGTENDSTTSPFDTSSSKTGLMPMPDSSFSFIPFFIEFENESEENSPPKTWKKVDTGHRSGSASWSFRRILLLLLGVAIFLTPTSTPPTAPIKRAIMYKADISLNACLRPFPMDEAEKLCGHLRSF